MRVRVLFEYTVPASLPVLLRAFKRHHVPHCEGGVFLLGSNSRRPVLSDEPGMLPTACEMLVAARSMVA